MSLNSLIKQLEDFSSKPLFWKALVHVGEFRVRTRVNYLPNGLEVIGAPGDWPRYIRLEETKAYLRRDLKVSPSKEVTPNYYVFYTWDPRRLIRAGIFKEKQVDGTTAWRAAYDAANLSPQLPDSLLKMLKPISGTIREIEYVVDKGDLGDEERLRELAVWDLSPEPTLVSLDFWYADGK